MSKIRFVGLDVHADTIAVAVAEPGGEVRSHGVIPNRIESVRKLIGKTRSSQAAKGLLRGWSHWLRTLLATDTTRGGVRGDRTELGTDQGGGSSQDGSARCRETGAMLSSGRTYSRLGAGCRA